MTTPDSSMLKHQVNKQEEHIYGNFNTMMEKLNQVEEGVHKAKHKLEHHLRNNSEVN